MVAIGFHYSIGGAKTGSGQFIERLNAAGIPVCMKGVGDAGLCFEAQESGKRHGVTNVLAYRVTNDATYQYDTPRYDLPPSEAARLHFDKTAVKWPAELDKALVWSEPINEPRAKLEPNETTPTWGGMHPVAWLGRFMVEYAQVARASGFKVCGPSFASGDPEVDLWQLEGMADWLRYCADNPDTAALSCHEYNYGSVPYADNCPWHYGRFQAILAAADVLGIPRTFSIIVTEFGWEQYWVPTFEAAVPVLELYGRLCAKFPQVKGIALWTLQDGWGGISDRLAQWIAPDGNPFANWVINNQYPTLDQPQPTAPEFGATLPTQPPDGGGGTMTTEIKSTVTYGTIEGRIKVRPQRWDSTLKNWVATGPAMYLELPAGTKRIAIDDEVEVDETENPNPPDVIVLPKGAKGVDVSAYQKGFFSKASPSKFDFFMFRCSDGMNTSATSKYHDANGVDTALLEFADVGHASGKPWGIYHFLRPGNVEAQISKVRMIHQILVDRGTPPRSGKFADGLVFAGIWADVEDYSLSNENVKQFIAGVGIVSTTGIYTGKYVWEAVTSGADVWWANKPLWLAAYGANNGQIPPWEAPSIPRGWAAVNVWQYTSEGQLVITEWTGDGLDLNSAGPYVPAVKPPDPPTGATYDTSFMRGEPGIWRVIRRGDGSGEDTWESKIDAQNDVRVKNTNEGEWYFYGLGGVWRKRDTSPAPDPTNGKQRYYVFTEGGQIAPNQAQVGVTYYYPNYVQFREKNIAAGCPNLPANSGPSTSTFLLKEVIKDYVFPGTGFKVDWLYVTVQTGETQLYAIHQGRVLGWVGGGATQANNVWAGELAEVYYDRAIPAQRPLEYC